MKLGRNFRSVSPVSFSRPASVRSEDLLPRPAGINLIKSKSAGPRPRGVIVVSTTLRMQQKTLAAAVLLNVWWFTHSSADALQPSVVTQAECHIQTGSSDDRVVVSAFVGSPEDVCGRQRCALSKRSAFGEATTIRESSVSVRAHLELEVDSVTVSQGDAAQYRAISALWTRWGAVRCALP